MRALISTVATVYFITSYILTIRGDSVAVVRIVVVQITRRVEYPDIVTVAGVRRSQFTTVNLCSLYVLISLDVGGTPIFEQCLNLKHGSRPIVDGAVFNIEHTIGDIHQIEYRIGRRQRPRLIRFSHGKVIRIANLDTVCDFDVLTHFEHRINEFVGDTPSISFRENFLITAHL